MSAKENMDENTRKQNVTKLTAAWIKVMRRVLSKPAAWVFTILLLVIMLRAQTTTSALFIASGTSVLGTGAISSATCATVVTTAATGTATTDVIWWGFNSDPTAVTGYVPATTGMLTIIAYPTTDNVNFKVCNNTTASVTPGARTLNWRILR